MKPKPKRLWCVMKAHHWETIKVAGLSVRPPAEGPHYFIPIFSTKAQAHRWAGSGEHVRELETAPQP